MAELAKNARRKRAKVAAVIMVAVLAVLLSACGGDDPAEDVTQGAELLQESFDTAEASTTSAWEEGAYPAAEPLSILAINDGRYQIDHRADDSASFTWGQGGEAFENVIIEVETEQLSPYKNNLYGVACRLAPDDRGEQSGYVLLISGDGHYGIAQLKRRTLDFLLEWHQTDEINEGRASNTIRAVCVDDYIALYVNGTFLGDVKDDDYQRAGQVGLFAGVNKGEDIRVMFDNLAVFEGEIGD